MLTQKTRYALHAMLYLAENEGRPVTVLEMADARGIPRKFLEQILSNLRARGLVQAKRGPNGGYHLLRAANTISFAEILRAIEGPLALAPCASLTAYAPCPDCKSVETCLIRPALMAVRDTSSMILEGISLAEAVGGKRSSFL